MLKHKIDVCDLLETKVKPNNFSKVSKKIFGNRSVINNYSHALNGRIWVSWNPREVDIISCCDSAQSICCQLFDLHSGLKFYFVATYDFNTVDLRRPYIVDFPC